MNRIADLCHGFAIRESAMLPDFQDFPIREHKHKRWMSDNYHKRIQKKWNKRFGFKKERYFLISKDHNAVFASPANIELLKKAMDDRNMVNKQPPLNRTQWKLLNDLGIQVRNNYYNSIIGMPYA